MTQMPGDEQPLSQRPHDAVPDDRLRGVRPAHIVALTLGYLAVAWGLFFAVDLLNLLGTRDLLAQIVPERHSTWHQLFHDGRVTEWLQWAALGAAGVLAAIHGGRLWEGAGPAARRLAIFWIIMAVALTLMLIEDAGNVRHMLRWYSYRFTGIEFIEHATEFLCFVALAVIPLYALLRYWRDHRQHRQTHRYLLAAFGFYALAASSSATRRWGEWHHHVGEAALAWFRSIDENFVIYSYTDYRGKTREGYWLLDMIVEESIELLGAAMFVCATLAFLHALRKQRANRETTVEH